MDLSLFSIANILLLFLLTILIVRFFWINIFRDSQEPLPWKEARKQGRLSPGLSKAIRWSRDPVRLYTFWLQVERLNREKVAGDFAELGVYRGASASLLQKMDPDRRFHLFDTFDGFPEQDLEKEVGPPAAYTPRHFSDTSVSVVLRHMVNPGNVQVYPGYFPETAPLLPEPVRFALVNIDVDLYLPTRKGLDFFYPRLMQGGVLFVHDYHPLWPGVIKAVDEFVATIPESLCCMADRDGTVMIVKNKAMG